MDIINTIDPATGEVVELYGKIIASFETGKAKILLVNTADFGDVLIINNEVQSSSSDEHIYHKALVGPAIRGCEERVVILGGGEGCTAREVLAGAPRAQVDQYDYDRGLVEWAADMLRGWNKGSYDNDRMNLHFEDVWSVDLPIADAYVIDIFDITAETTAAYLRLLEDCICRLRVGGRLTAYLGDRSAKLEDFICRCQGLPASADCTIRSYTATIPSYRSEASLFLYVEKAATVAVSPVVPDAEALEENTCNPGRPVRP